MILKIVVFEVKIGTDKRIMCGCATLFRLKQRPEKIASVNNLMRKSFPGRSSISAVRCVPRHRDDSEIVTGVETVADSIRLVLIRDVDMVRHRLHCS